MELKISVAELKQGLSRTQGLVERKTTMPVLANVLLEAQKDTGLTLSAFDLEIGVVGQHRCEVLKEGAVALPARHFYDIVRLLPDPNVTLRRAPNSQIEISSGSSRFRIVSTPAEEFPALPKPEAGVGFELPADLLALMIERTRYAISTDETRYNLGGVYLEQLDRGVLRMVATDGHRLSLCEREVSGTEKLEHGVLIPKKGLQELKRLLDEDGGPCQLAFNKGSAVVRRSSVVMVMRLLDGQFPDYRQVIPKESERAIQLSRGKLIETLRRVSLVSSDKTYGVRLEVDEGKIELTSQNPDLGEAHEEIEAEVKGGPIKAGFNAHYLIDALSAFSSDQIRIDLADELSPAVLRPVGENGDLAVVMPMRL